MVFQAGDIITLVAFEHLTITFVKKIHRIITLKNLNDTTILSSEIIPLMYLDVTRCITYSPPEFPKAAWGGEVTKRATQSC